MKFLVELLLLISCAAWLSVFLVAQGYVRNYVKRYHSTVLKWIAPLIYSVYFLALANALNIALAGIFSIMGRHPVQTERAGSIFLSQVAIVVFAYMAHHYYRNIPEFVERMTLHKRNSDRFRAIADSIHDAVVEYDSDGVIWYANNGASRMFGYSSLLGEDFYKLLAHPMNMEHMARVKEVSRTGKNRFATQVEPAEMIAVGVDGNHFPIELTLSAYEITTETGSSWRFTAMIRDIAKRKALEKNVSR